MKKQLDEREGLCECVVPGDCPDDSTPGCKLAEGRKPRLFPCIPIERRIELRSALARIRETLVVVTPDELEALLDAYEHGGFQTKNSE